MNTGLKGKAALICGASRGLGLACAEKLAGEGAKVILLSRNKDLLFERVSNLNNRGVEARFIPADLSVIEEIPAIAKKAEAFWGNVDILINNAGGPPSGPNLSFNADVWIHSFKQNFLSAEELTKLLIPAMAESGWGRIINLTSITVKQPVENLILSNSIRMAVTGWAKTLSLEFAAAGVTVNNIATGYTLTERINELAAVKAEQSGRDAEDVIEEMASKIPMKRMAEPEEIASAAAFLASDAASYITGVTLPVDGGYIAGV
ncbi:MAG: SDR family oxidoreductase [Spirochaetes bacterium]|nr:SDR family oxidoreductase [Spirochaetota bacterium]